MNVLIERHGRVVLVRLNRPQVKNALSSALMLELVACLEVLDRDPQVGCFVITGGAQYFAAGAQHGVRATYGCGARPGRAHRYRRRCSRCCWSTVSS